MGHFDEFKAEMEALTKKMEARGKEVFQQESQSLFENNLDLISFSWQQYTPYFNDGDTCEFGVNDYLDVGFVNNEILENWSGSEYDRKYSEGSSEENMGTADAAHDLVASIPEDVMKSIFGDHVKITVFRDRVEVEEYDHE